MTGRVTAAALLALPWGAAAQDMVPDDGRATWTFTAENDGYFGDDDNYTSGLRLSYLSGNGTLDAAAEVFTRRLLGLEPDRDRMRVRRGFALAQEIYTPENLKTEAPLPDQHPYAAHLYAEYTALIEQPNRVDQIAFQLGVVGPEAQGEHAQNAVHDFTERERALGWDNQLPTALGVGVSYDQQRRVGRGRLGPLGWDLVPSVGFTAGTVETSARAGLNLRFGENLVAGYGPPRVRPATAGSGFFVPRKGRSWYLFAGGSIEAVAHSIYLDGALFRESDEPEVTSRPLVGDLQGGAAVQLGRAQLSFTYIYRTREFEEQPDGQAFGAFSVATKF